MYSEGRIETWHRDKGYGFASTRKGTTKVFLHAKEFESREFEPEAGQEIRFIIREDAPGKLVGETIQFCNPEQLTRKRQKIGKLALLLCLVFVAFVSWSIQQQLLPVFIAIGYLTISIITFVLYFKDKRASQRGQWRTSEKSLQFFALLGGWPGALVAQGLLGHKTKKRNFQIVFYVMVAINLALLGQGFSEQGDLWLRSTALNLNFYIAGSIPADFVQLWWWKIQYWVQKL